MSRGRKRLTALETAAAAQPPPRRQPADAVECLILRSHRCKRKGDTRRALVLLWEACALDDRRACTWALLGALLAELRRREEAAAAFEQARWRRARAGEAARAAVLARLVMELRCEAA